MDNDQCVAVMHTQGIQQFEQGRPHIQIAGLWMRNAEGLDCFAALDSCQDSEQQADYVSMSEVAAPNILFSALNVSPRSY